MEAQVRLHAAVEPPPPGPIPFREGERASYSVSWNGAPNVTAGTIEMRVEGPPYRFVVSADTAPWIARFYEVHAVLTTVANHQLMPQQHQRRMQEGSRSLDRTYVFDPEGGVIRIAPTVEEARSGKAVTLQYLSAAFHVFFNPSFRYVRELAGERDAVLEFLVEIEGIAVNGVDMIRWDDQGRIVDFKVMIRPLKAINLIHQKMAAMLQANQ